MVLMNFNIINGYCESFVNSKPEMYTMLHSMEGYQCHNSTCFIKACLHDARFLAQSLWTRPPMTFGTSCSILRARSCMQDCAYTLQDVKVIKWLVI